MAAKYFSYFLITLLFIKSINMYSVHVKVPEIKEKDFTMKSHLKNAIVLKFCEVRDVTCSSNNSDVCAFRFVNKSKSFKTFKNVCFLFMSNMCDYPGDEYHILHGGTCEDYLAQRRNTEIIVQPDDNDNNVTEYENSFNSTEVNVTEAPSLRHGETTEFSHLYDIDSAFDYHDCPPSCTNDYAPVCVNINRGFGKYFKMMSFVNHCMADLYYCQNWREFKPPPNEEETVRASPLGWSFCGASRYLQFARFAEVTSSMGHYGWLAGNHRYSHIMEPHERIPGYG
ncbi:uncharacterized protein LOC142985611 [Anticarsia gemmatalis]|uniref:uncharacterized protein LOC142985611 n=1 Tax=Anticarsia gemmatalis TaxID=129554 RepID=UPI003F76FC1A